MDESVERRLKDLESNVGQIGCFLTILGLVLPVTLVMFWSAVYMTDGFTKLREKSSVIDTKENK